MAPPNITGSGNSLGNPDGFVTKLNPTGNAIVYSTYLGGSKTDIIFGIAVAANGEACVTGTSDSDPSDNPLAIPNFARRFGS